MVSNFSHSRYWSIKWHAGRGRFDKEVKVKVILYFISKSISPQVLTKAWRPPLQCRQSVVCSLPWWYKYLRSPLCQKQSFYASKRSIYDSKLSICQLGDSQNTLFYVIYSSGWKNRNIHAWRTWSWVSSSNLSTPFCLCAKLAKTNLYPSKKVFIFY